MSRAYIFCSYLRQLVMWAWERSCFWFMYIPAGTPNVCRSKDSCHFRYRHMGDVVWAWERSCFWFMYIPSGTPNVGWWVILSRQRRRTSGPTMAVHRGRTVCPSLCPCVFPRVCVRPCVCPSPSTIRPRPSSPSIASGWNGARLVDKDTKTAGHVRYVDKVSLSPMSSRDVLRIRKTV
jgi:hypothetical protein